MENKDYNGWIDLNYITKTDIKNIASIISPIIKEIIGDIIVKALYGNSNWCTDIYLDIDFEDWYIIYHANDNGEYTQRLRADDILKSLKGKIYRYNTGIVENNN